MGEGQVLVDEGPGRQRRRVELPGREQDLAVPAVDLVAVVVHRDEVVVGADLLELPEGLEQRLPVPEPDVLDGRRVGLDVGQGEIGLALELPGLHAVDPPRLAGRGDVVDEIRRLPGQLGGRHHELLHDHRNEAAPDDAQRHIAADRQEGVAGQPLPETANQDGDGGEDGDEGRDSERRQAGVEIGVAGPDQRAGGRVEQAGDVHQPEPERGEDEERRQQAGDVHAGRGLDAEPPGAEDDVAPERVDRDQRQEREDGDGGQEPERRGDAGQREDVEADVAGEDRVPGPERCRVDHPEHQAPGRRRGQAGQQTERQGDRQAQPAQRAGDVHPRRRLDEPEHHRVGDQAALGDPEVEVEQAEGQTADDQEDQHPGDELAGEDDLVADLLEPPPVGEQADEAGDEEQPQEDGDGEDQEEAAMKHG